jgi:uncharacterized damage-inducible protein DinB
MNASDILKYGNGTVMHMIGDIPDDQWETPNVCGWWSVKNIMAHLTSFEHMLTEVLRSFVDSQPTPYMDQMRDMGGQGFNDFQVDIRKDKSPAETLQEYQAAHARVMELVVQIPDELRQRPGTLPWYGDEYALDDFLVYQYYGHKREHMAQVGVFKDQITQSA